VQLFVTSNEFIEGESYIHDECGKQVQSDGVLCIMHGGIPIKKRCSHKGCAKQVQNNGVCVTHGAIARTGTTNILLAMESASCMERWNQERSAATTGATSRSDTTKFASHMEKKQRGNAAATTRAATSILLATESMSRMEG